MSDDPKNDDLLPLADDDWKFAEGRDLHEEFRREGFFVDEALQIDQNILRPNAREREILQAFFEVRPTCGAHQEAAIEVAHRLHVPYADVLDVLRRTHAKREARIQRREYADRIYEDKLQLAKGIIGKSLMKLNDYLDNFVPTTIEDAKGLTKIATDITGLLRLELGKPTQQVEVMHRTNKTMTVVLSELKAADPFMDYPELEVVQEKKDEPSVP